jgi:hypothetical protein
MPGDEPGSLYCVANSTSAARSFSLVSKVPISEEPEAIELKWRSRYGVTIYLPQDWNGLHSMNFFGVRRRLGVPIREYHINAAAARRDTFGSLTFPRDDTAASDPAHAARLAAPKRRS